MNNKIMELGWIDEGDGNTEFTDESVGASASDGAGLGDRLNAAADYLVEKYGIGIIEARCRLWNQGDFYPRLENG